MTQPQEHDVMPVFVIKARDNLALGTVEHYARACEAAGLHGQAMQVARAGREIAEWRDRNRHLCKWPDHDHVPAGEPGSGSEKPEETSQ